MIKRNILFGYFVIIPALLMFLLTLPLLQSWLMKTEYYGRWLDVSAPSWEQIESVSLLSEQTHSLSKSLSNRFVWVYFGYLHCDGFCQQQWVTLFHLMQKLSKEPVSVLLISIDPQRDSVTEFQSLAEELGDHFVSLVPDSLLAAQTLANHFHSPFQKSSIAFDYQVQHAGDIFLIAPDGRIKFVYTGKDWHYDQLQKDYLNFKKTLR